MELTFGIPAKRKMLNVELVLVFETGLTQLIHNFSLPPL